MSEKRVTGSDFNFAEAPLFRKIAKLAKINVIIAKGGEEITTRHLDNQDQIYVETFNVAKAGDYIVTRNDNDVYILSSSGFAKAYEDDPDDPYSYRSKFIGKAVHINEDVVLLASWGKDQHIRAGGVIFENGTGGNQAHSFENDFARLGVDGSLMPLTANFNKQLTWAIKLNDKAHLTDIKARQEFVKNSIG